MKAGSAQAEKTYKHVQNQLKLHQKIIYEIFDMEERFLYYTGVKKFPNDKTRVPILNKKSEIEHLDNRSTYCSNVYLEKSIKKEVEQAEFETGMAVLEDMDQSSLNKIPKTEPLDIKPKIEPKD